MQEEKEIFLSEALKKAIQIVETVEECYRELAFPIVLQSIVEDIQISDPSTNLSQETSGMHTPEMVLPLTMSVNEFFRRVNPDSHPARFVTAAYYLLHTEQSEQFTNVDILNIYRKLRQPQPKNPTDVMNQCIRKAHIIDASGKDKQKYWAITPDGEKYVEGLLNDNSSSNTIAG